MHCFYQYGLRANNLQGLSILLHRPTPWQSSVTCSTKIFAGYFREDGFKVAYMESPLDLGHIVKWKGYYNIWKNAPREENGIWIINPFTPLPIRDHFPLNTKYCMDASYRYSIPSIDSLLKRGGMQSPDIVWSARPGGAVFKRLFPRSKLIMQVVDYYPAFRGDYIKAIEQRDYEVADHIFLIGHAMWDYVIGELGIDAGKVSVLGQGVALEWYSEKTVLPEDLRNIPGPRAVWVGVLQKVDIAMLEEAAKALVDIGGSLVLIGPFSSWAVEFRSKYQNVYLLGSKRPQEVPAYLLHCDIGLMLYDRGKGSIYYGQNPLKLYEYAAAGLAILSTPHREYQFIDAPIIELRTAEEVRTGVEHALTYRDSFRQKSLEFARKHNWADVFATARDKVLCLIEKG